MRRVFLPEPLTETITISGSDAHHIIRVLRLKPGDRLSVVGADRQAGEAVIKDVRAGTIVAELVARIELLGEPPVAVWLAQGLPKGDKMDLVVQKTVELGVSGIIPLATEHSVVRYDAAKQANRVARWQIIAYEASKQCGRGKVPTVTDIMSLADCLEQLPPGVTILMLYEGEKVQGLRAALTAANGSGEIVLLIGPEGGFSPAEVELCKQYGAKMVSLGPRILRTETAAIAALAIVMYQCGDLGG